jgi:hypothetical protein
MPEVNFNLLNPGAELYSGPQVTLDPVKAYETAQAKQQSNMLAQLYAKHYDPQTGGVNYNSLIGEAAQSGLGKYIPDIMGDAQKQSQSTAEIAQKRALQQQEEATAAAKQDEIRREKIKEMATESYGRFRGVKDEESLKAWHLANPELEGTNKAERTAKLQQDIKDKGYDAVRAEIEGSLQAITGIKPEKVAESDLAQLLREQKNYKPNSPEWKAYQAKINDLSGGMSEYQRQYLAHLAEQEKRLATTSTTGGKTTVNEQQASYNVNRLLNAADQITNATNIELGAQKPSLLEAAVGSNKYTAGLTGATQSAQRQIVDAAQSDMLDALLYLSTGAAYNKEQLEGQKKSYLPALLDKPETVNAKKSRLITLIADAKKRAGNAWDKSMDDKMASVLANFGKAASAGGKTPAKPSGKGTKEDPIVLDDQ